MKAHHVLTAVAALAVALFASSAPAAEAAAAPKIDLARGQAISTQVCAACHTADGTRGAAANPILQGQHPEYLAKQLAEFKSGARQSPIMKAFASALSEDDMRNVAAFYGSKPATRPGNAKNKELATLGEKIWRGGIADKAVPACAACHGPAGSGIPSQYPRLGGQHADYAEAQLNAFRTGVRKNAQMTAIASKLSDREVKALADYAAGLH